MKQDEILHKIEHEYDMLDRGQKGHNTTARVAISKSLEQCQQHKTSLSEGRNEEMESAYSRLEDKKLDSKRTSKEHIYHVLIGPSKWETWGRSFGILEDVASQIDTLYSHRSINRCGSCLGYVQYYIWFSLCIIHGSTRVSKRMFITIEKFEETAINSLFILCTHVLHRNLHVCCITSMQCIQLICHV